MENARITGGTRAQMHFAQALWRVDRATALRLSAGYLSKHFRLNKGILAGTFTHFHSFGPLPARRGVLTLLQTSVCRAGTC
jgi:hypothetical protein